MLCPGICSVTFRRLSPAEIVALVSNAGLKAIEWGGDVHVPPGDLEQARIVRHLTEDAGLRVASYGSYFKVGCDDNSSNFLEVLETAAELGAPSIRIWAGNRGSVEANEAWRQMLIEETKRISCLSQQRGIQLSYEYHGHTLTDNLESTMMLMEELNDKGVFMYWQPELEKDTVGNLQVLRSLSPWLSNLHVFHYSNKYHQSLDTGKEDWRQYLNALPVTPEYRYVMLEFVKNGEPEQFLQDADVLKSLIIHARTE